MRPLSEVERLVNRVYHELMEKGYCAIPEAEVKRSLSMMYAIGADDDQEHNVRSVEQLNPVTGEVIRPYKSLSQAARAIGVNRSVLHRAVNGGYTCQNFRWRYRDITP